LNNLLEKLILQNRHPFIIQYMRRQTFRNSVSSFNYSMNLNEHSFFMTLILITPQYSSVYPIATVEISNCLL